MTETKFDRAYKTLTEVAAQHFIGITHPGQMIEFSKHFPSSDHLVSFASAIRSRGYSIPVNMFRDLYDRPVTVSYLANTLAGHDDTEGNP